MKSFIIGDHKLSIGYVGKRKKPVLMAFYPPITYKVLASFVSEDEAEMFSDYLLEMILMYKEGNKSAK